MRRALLSLLLTLTAYAAVPFGFNDARVGGTNLVGWWTFNDGTNAANYSGYGINGVATNTPTVVTGKMGTALLLNGTTQVIHLGKNYNASNGVGFTFSIWFSTVSLLDTTQGLIAKSRAASEGGRWGLFRDPGNILGVVIVSSNNSAVFNPTVSISPYTNGVFHHLTATLDQQLGVAAFYTNGVLQTNFTNANFVGGMTNNDILTIGSYPNSGGQTAASFFAGTVDDVRIYNRALTAEEVKMIYNQRAGGQ